MAAALYFGEPIAIHMFRQDVEVAKVISLLHGRDVSSK